MTVTPYRPEELDEHTLGHILTEMQDQERDDNERLDRPTWREILLGVGYAAPQVEQILERWFVKCSACGERDATHMWASFDPDGTIGSMAGPGRMTPSCDECSGDLAGNVTGLGVLRAFLDFKLTPPKPVSREQIVTTLIGGDPAIWFDAFMKAGPMESGIVRECLAQAIDGFARAVSGADSDIVVDYDTVLLDLVTDARTLRFES